jgi:hypothetical protein
MKITHKPRECNTDIYHVGNVIMMGERAYMVIGNPNIGYAFLSLRDGFATRSYPTLGELTCALGDQDDQVVEAELVIYDK